MTPEEHADNIARWTNQGIRQAVIDEIAAAVAAERERCAKVAEDAEDGHTNTYRNSEDDYNASCGYNEACSNIAAAIRSGK